MSASTPRSLALTHIAKSHKSRLAAKIVLQHPETALRDLLRSGSGYQSAGALAPFKAELVSLPDQQTDPVSLLDMLPDSDSKLLRDLSETSELFVEDDTLRNVNDDTGSTDCYVDLSLTHDDDVYARFVRRLLKCGVVRLAQTPPQRCR